jgi:hypothetical protein
MDPVRVDIKEVKLQGDILVFTSQGGEVHKLPFNEVSLCSICEDESLYLAVADRYVERRRPEWEQIRRRDFFEVQQLDGKAYFAGLPQETIWEFIEAVRSGRGEIVYKKD